MSMMGFHASSTESVLAAPQALLTAQRKLESGGATEVKMLLLPVWFGFGFGFFLGQNHSSGHLGRAWKSHSTAGKEG